MRWFKKWDARQKLLLSNGGWYEFSKAGDWGVVGTNDHFLIKNFEQAIRDQRGGVVEITHGEYEELKKKAPHRKPYNEAFSGMEYLSLVKKWRDRAVRVGTDVLQDIHDAWERVPSRDIQQIVTVNQDWKPASVKR